MPGRRYSPSSGSGLYRYGFNGKENDNDVKGEGNQQDYGMRIYDPRLGKFSSVDPLTKDYPELTPYQFASNTPIESIDLDGAERLSYLDRNESHNALDFVGNLPGNVVVTAYNGIAGAWNKLVDYGTAMSEGDPIAGFNLQASKDWDSFKSGVKSIWDYHANTPIKQQGKDFINQASSWDTWSQAMEGAVLFYVGVQTTTILKTERVTTTAIKTTETASKVSKRIGLAKGFMGDAYKRYSGDVSINFNKAVYKQSIGPETFKTKQLVQWREPGNPNAGPFFTFDGVDPQTLGIPSTYTQKFNVTLDNNYNFLRSTANDVPAWKKADAGKTYRGGGVQLYSPEAAKNAIFTPSN